MSFPSPQVNLSAPAPPVSTSLQLPAANKVSLPLPAYFAEWQTPLSVEETILLLEIIIWFELRLELLSNNVPELELSNVLLSLSASETRLWILDFRLSANWDEPEEFVKFDWAVDTLTDDEVKIENITNILIIT